LPVALISMLNKMGLYRRPRKVYLWKVQQYTLSYMIIFVSVASFYSLAVFYTTIAEKQRDDIQAATINELTILLQQQTLTDETEQDHLVAYIDILPRDMRFALVKSLLRIPPIAAILCQDKYDAAILETIRKISQDAL